MMAWLYCLNGTYARKAQSLPVLGLRITALAGGNLCLLRRRVLRGVLTVFICNTGPRRQIIHALIHKDFGRSHETSAGTP